MARPMTQPELDLVRDLLSRAGLTESEVGLTDRILVEEMDDGGMGSLRFECSDDVGEHRVLGRALVEATYKDSDGIVVSIALNADAKGMLYELDIWKTDFSPLQVFPTPEMLADASDL